MDIASVLNDVLTSTMDFIRSHKDWAFPLAFLLAFGETLAFISLILPATMILIAMGALAGAEDSVAFVPLWLAASAGAFCGDWVSYLIGKHYKDKIAHMWPLKRYPTMLDRGHAFFERWGMLGVFIGRFFGPMRAVIPLISGICEMPKRYFQLVNAASALVWTFLLLAPGAFGMRWLVDWIA